jgi:hypothetical protein
MIFLLQIVLFQLKVSHLTRSHSLSTLGGSALSRSTPLAIKVPTVYKPFLVPSYLRPLWVVEQRLSRVEFGCGIPWTRRRVVCPSSPRFIHRKTIRRETVRPCLLKVRYIAIASSPISHLSQPSLMLNASRDTSTEEDYLRLFTLANSGMSQAPAIPDCAINSLQRSTFIIISLLLAFLLRFHPFLPFLL